MRFDGIRWPRTAALRGALWITLIALLATGLALTIQYVQTIRLLDERMQALVDDEASALVHRYQVEGVSGVANAIEQQQQIPRIQEFFYLLALPDGRPVVGNLVGWPAEVNEPGFHSFTTEVVNTRGASSRRRVEARAIQLEGGFRLLVGNFADERAILRERYRDALFWSLLATGVLGLLLGLWYSRRGLKFVEAVSDTGQRFLLGRLDERLPVSSKCDEYDRLAVTINRCFDEVERLVGSLRATTDGVAHDLKTPLTRIRARLELAELDGALSRDAPEVIADIRQDLDTLLTLIENVLGLARVEAIGATGFDKLALDVIAAETIDLFDPVASDKGVELIARIEPAIVAGSRSLLAQLVANLIDNAIKFAPDGGQVRLELKQTEHGSRLTVSDNGPGIPAENREQVLARFFRLDSSRSLPGSGIGLSIVAAAARLHGAELQLLDNNPGLRVVVDFPPSINLRGDKVDSTSGGYSSV